ncbi:unnamed protein product [Spirodela intermedia]|uniref:Auxin-responsive protein n=2 Tax=Spirodela intermedia TaxID=51605 RepID=A0A7I8KZ72_SPIIN|nr:unnamed protein product [Spirodela intermedia]CAA6666321.1 unnamed protein product [Spirodela intermedia]CAA7403099.1 unnamed protein product [Spirodela intermedia]
MTAEAAKSSAESGGSGLDFEETELKLAPPGWSSRGGGTSAEGERKRGFSEAVEPDFGGSSSDTWTAHGIELSARSEESKPSSAAKPAAKAQVVGWPPVRSFQKKALKSCSYVKVAVDGAPYLRKVDLEIYSGYQDLLAALEEMFSCFTTRNYPTERRLVDTVNGMEYVPTYEDKDGDWMLVGDVPWKMFVETCRRLRLKKSSEAVNLVPRTTNQRPAGGR